MGVSRVYSIGIYAAGPDLRFAPAEGAQNPVLTTASVTDVVATTVADPFMLVPLGEGLIGSEIEPC